MTKKAKLLQRLVQLSADLTWDEAATVMKQHNFEMLKGDGSGRKFVHATTRTKVFIHKPHPGNIVKTYAQRDLLEGLRNAGEIE